MGISDRINGWVENRRPVWANPLETWAANFITRGITKSLEDMEPGAIAAYSASLTKLKDNPLTPPEIKAFCDKALEPGNPVSVVGGLLLMLLQMIGVVMGGSRPLGNLIGYAQDLALKSYRLDPAEVITAWRRNPTANEKYFQDLREQGWTEDRLLALRTITEAFPNVQDIIRFAVREAYSPEIAEKFGQYEDLPTSAAADLLKVGLPWDEFRKYWAAHWELPSAEVGFELLHRAIIDEPTLKLLLRAHDVMPYWRDQLIKLSWNIPTRVDVRRFWDMRTIDEKRLREIYTGLGYHAQDLEDYVLWTKIYVDFPDLLARYKNGWITLDQVKEELVAMGMKPERADTMIEEKVKKAAPERVAAEKTLTKTEIYKGVKQEKITWEQGVELLMDLGYDVDEANYLMAINIAVAAGSPEDYAEFKDLTQKYRKAAGLEGKPVNEEIRKAAAEVIRLTGDRDSLQKSIEQEKRGLLTEGLLPAEATARLNTLQASLRQAEAELARVKTEYSRLVVEFKHTSL